MDSNTKQGKNLLNIDELDGVVGGADTGNTGNGGGTKKLYCNDPRCKQERIFYLGSGGRATCSFCHTQIMY